jgi:hypothetical protein
MLNPGDACDDTTDAMTLRAFYDWFACVRLHAIHFEVHDILLRWHSSPLNTHSAAAPTATDCFPPFAATAACALIAAPGTLAVCCAA